MGAVLPILKFMKSLFLLPLLSLLLLGQPACRSSKTKKSTPESRELSRLGDPEPDAQIGGYYKLRGNMNGFYFNVPNFTDVLPNRFLMRGHVVQLLDPTAGDGWARVKNEDLQIGYVKFEQLKIVPYEKQPRPKKRDTDEDLERGMNLN